ncbi:MAG: hypothetical protein M3Y56_06640, partial [Armatimonadota bacterium]|nr:hypothetical protein [Armatimonadota bacterium]
MAVPIEMKNHSPTPKNPRRFRALLLVLTLLCGVAAAVFIPPAWDAVRLREAYLPELESIIRKSPHDGRLLSLVGARLAEAGDYKAAAQ